MLGHPSPQCLAVAARIPLALAVLALAFAVEAFARRAFTSPDQHDSRARVGFYAGLYAALILLSCPGIFLFTRILLPDAMLCLWLTLAIYAFWLTEQPQSRVPHVRRGFFASTMGLHTFAACCALGVLTKGLIGLLFPIAIVALYLILTRGWKGTADRLRRLHPISSTAIFLAIAAPWHILIALANPTHGHPANLTFGHGHWQVPLPTDGNVHGWAWFYFVNEHLLRYLNLRVPRDYDTVPLWLFLGLCLIWLMPWSAFLFQSLFQSTRSAVAAIASSSKLKTPQLKAHEPSLPQISQAPQSRHDAAPKPQTHLLLLLWAAIPLLFFCFSTRQEYYVLPSLPPLAILIAAWLASDSAAQPASHTRRTALRSTGVVLALGTLFAAATCFFLIKTRDAPPNADLATLLQQNPADYALAMGHFLDLNARALALFRLPLAIAAAALFLGPLAAFILRRRARAHAANLALAAGAFGFLLAAHLGLQTFAPVLSSQQLAAALAPQLQPGDLVVIHQEYEYASTLGFYLQRPAYRFTAVRLSPPQTAPPGDNDRAAVTTRPIAVDPIHILTDDSYSGTPNYGRSSNLWYGSFFPDAPPIFETAQSLAAKWPGPRRIFLWQDLASQPSPVPPLPGPIYIIATSGGKQVLSNQPSR
jgi:4-amino-4-deoxy-L-arabinose transferase-like glycosyltransferase